jgi:hypothetical protein
VKYGPERLITELQTLGYKAELVTGGNSNLFAVIPNFTVTLGQFADRTIGLGIAVTNDFPKSVGSSIHIRANPQLFECKDSAQNVRNITPSELGGEWRYWSINFKWTEERTTRRLMSQINGVFERA